MFLAYKIHSPSEVCLKPIFVERNIKTYTLKEPKTSLILISSMELIFFRGTHLSCLEINVFTNRFWCFLNLKPWTIFGIFLSICEDYLICLIQKFLCIVYKIY